MHKKKLKIFLLTVCTAIAAAMTVRLARPALAETIPSGGDAAYAVFNSSTGELDFIRSTELHKNGETGTVTSISGGIYTGAIFTGFETASDVSNHPFQNIAASVKTVKFVDTIRPVSCRYWFESMTQCTDIVLDKLDTANVTDMGFMFYKCSGLTSLNVSKFNTGNVTNMDAMFSGCNSLTSLDLSAFDTSNVKTMSGMFRDCKSLESLDVSKFNTANVTNMMSMFRGCSSLTSLDISKFNTANVKYTDLMFYNCNKLQTVKIGTKFTQPIGLTGFYKIADADGNQVIDEKAYDLWELDQTTTPSLAGTWSKTPLKAILSPTFKTVDGFTENATSFSHGTKEAYEANKANAKEIQSDSSTRKIYMWHDADNNYYWYSQMDTVYLPSNCADLFSYDERYDRKAYKLITNKTLASIDLSDLNWSEVTNTRKMFACLQGLTELNLGDVDTSHVTDMYGMFGKISVPILDVSKLDTSQVTCMDAMFYGAHTQNVIGLENFDTSKVTSMAGMFMNSYITNLDSIKGWDVTHVAEFDENGHFEIVGAWIAGCDGGIFAWMPHLDSIDLSGWQVSKDKGLFFGWGSAHFTKIRFGTGFEGFIYYGPDSIYYDSGCPMYKVEDANGNPMKDFRVHDLSSVKQPTLAGLWVKTAPDPYTYTLAVRDPDGQLVKSYTMSEKDTYVTAVKAGDDGQITEYSTQSRTTTESEQGVMPPQMAFPDTEIMRTADDTTKNTTVSNLDESGKSKGTPENVYTLTIIPSMDKSLKPKVVTITTKNDLTNTIHYELSNDTSVCKIDGATFDEASQTLTVTLDRDDSAGDKASWEYYSKEKIVEIGAGDDFVLKLTTPATTKQTYDASDTSKDMTFGIFLDTVPGIDSIPESESDSSWTADSKTLTGWAKTWTVKVGDTTLTDDQKTAAFQNFKPLLQKASDGTHTAGVKLDLAYLESIGLIGKPLEITMSHTVTSEKLKDGKYTTKVYIYSDSAYDVMYVPIPDPDEQDGDSMFGDGTGKLHIYNAVSDGAPDQTFTFKIIPDNEDCVLPSGADTAVDSDGKKYAVVKITGNGYYTGTLHFTKDGKFGYTITCEDGKASGWTYDTASSYHLTYSTEKFKDDPSGKQHTSAELTAVNGKPVYTIGSSGYREYDRTLQQNFQEKLGRVKQKALNQILIVDTCLMSSGYGVGFEQSYSGKPVTVTPKLTRARFAMTAFVGTPNVNYNLTLFKRVTGEAVPASYSFKAVITPDNENCPMPENTDTWYDADTHTVTLDSKDGGRARVLNFTAKTAGTYGYTIKETASNKFGWDYDSHTYHVQYTIADGAVKSVIQKVDGQAITSAQKADNLADYTDYTGKSDDPADALVAITNRHYQMVVPSGFQNPDYGWIVAACAGAAVAVILVFRHKRASR